MIKYIPYKMRTLIGVLTVLMWTQFAWAGVKDSVTVHVPPVGVGLLMVDAAQDPSLKKYFKQIKIQRWNTPDQMRGGVLDGSINITFVPSYAGANLYNKGIDFRLMNIITGGLLYVISTDASLKKVEDLVGKTVVVPFPNDMPDLVLQAMIQKLQLNGVNIKRVAAPPIAVKLAMSGQADTILLPEIAATKVMLGAKKKAGITFHRSIDLTKEYGRIFNTKAFIPQAGVAVRNSFWQQNKQFIGALQTAMENSAKALEKDPARIQKMTEIIWKGEGPIFAKSYAFWNVYVDDAKALRPEIEQFYKIMSTLNPAIIGGKMPDAGFYLNP